MTTVIEAENLGKKYINSHEKTHRYRYKTFQESLLGANPCSCFHAPECELRMPDADMV